MDPISLKSTAEVLGTLFSILLMIPKSTSVPVYTESPSCANISTSSFCRNSEKLSRNMATFLRGKTQSLLPTYLSLQSSPFSDNNGDQWCNMLEERFTLPVDRDIGRLNQIQNVLGFINASLLAIAEEQENLNPNVTSLHKELRSIAKRTVSLIASTACLMCKRYQILIAIDVPELRRPPGIFDQKRWSCSVLKRSIGFFSPNLLA
ncbi:leukemia inhibitory factor-like [Polypterus senegalus]|uniref:leukemia inhibitory factor-like n=1 Tax=Polypterus senegalus TaxID=55291 RepID=UPI00196626FD|nr:leukemia inhibitory factor-like [Polypterus senegalus]